MPPELTEEPIVDLAITLKGNSCDVSISNIIVRSNNSNLNEKGMREIPILQNCVRKEN